MNTQPVAWMELYYGEPNNLSWTNVELRDSGEVYKTIPLYTLKELTDEEIWKLWQEHLDDEIPVFARAILRKAQEK
jgi:hypothetical protein